VNVLVVDDYAELLELVGRALENDRHSVRTVATYADAVFELERARPDLAILDLVLIGRIRKKLAADTVRTVRREGYAFGRD
jgi:DNA-binding response OmpR family regulator